MSPGLRQATWIERLLPEYSNLVKDVHVLEFGNEDSISIAIEHALVEL